MESVDSLANISSSSSSRQRRQWRTDGAVASITALIRLDVFCDCPPASMHVPITQTSLSLSLSPSLYENDSPLIDIASLFRNPYIPPTLLANGSWPPQTAARNDLVGVLVKAKFHGRSFARDNLVTCHEEVCDFLVIFATSKLRGYCSRGI